MTYHRPTREHSISQFKSKVEAAVYATVAPLAVTAWTTREPVSYSRRRSGRRLTLQPGDKWGNLFDCAWFHFAGRVPAAAAGKQVVLLIDVNGEACVFNDRGEPVQGLTNISSEYDFSLGRPGKRVVPMFKRAAGGEKIDLWADAGCNDLFGKLQGGGTLKQAQIAVLNPSLHQLYYDIEVLEELMKELPRDSARHQKILQGLAEAAVVMREVNEAEAQQARRILKPLLETRGGDPSLTISAIGHSHMDLAWLWPVRETKRKCARTFSTVLRMMERYPDYHYGASQPQQYKWTREEYPSLYRQMRKRIAEGRWEVQGGMWVEADTNITSGESLVRQFLYGKRFWRKEFGVESRELWIPDVFGYSGALPQIMSKCGVDYFMTQKLSWSLVNAFPHHSFWWQGIDGTKVLAHMLPEETYNSPASPRAVAKAEKNYRDSAVSSHALMLFGIGDGGGGPGEEHLERLAREKNLAGLCPVVQEPAAAFFRKWETEAEKFATWRGELYLERHQGTLTTQARSKRFNRQMELALRDCEMLASIASAAGRGYPAAELATIWEEVLLYQFHDILPGSSITRVYDESLKRYAELLSRTRHLAADAERTLLRRIDTSASKKPVVVFNTLSWQRTEMLNLSGRWAHVTVPGCGYCVIDESALAPIAAESPTATERLLENDLLRIRFNADGSIASVWDKQNQRETLEAGRAGNRLAVWDDSGDAWDFPMDYRDRTPRYFELEKAEARVDGPLAVLSQSYRFGKSTLTQEIRLMAGSRRVDFVTHVDWQESGKMLRTSFPTSIQTDNARCEIQFGSVERPTHRSTSWDAAKFEINAHKWIDLSDKGYGVALLNDCKYGHCVLGGEIDLNLLRSPGHPDPVADRAEHDFTYSLYPHAGDHISGGVVSAGYELNVPLRPTRTTAHAGDLPAAFSFIEIDSPNVIVEAVKKSEDGDDLIVRLYECHGASTRCTVRLNVPAKKVSLVNMLEEQPKPLKLKRGVVELDFGPYTIHTLRVAR